MVLPKSELVEKSENILNSLDLRKLKEAGFSRDKYKYEFIVTYPPLPALSNITQEEIFSEQPETPKQIGLYVHLPFCTGTCTYCSRFIRAPQKSIKSVEDYLALLKKELLILKSMPALKDVKITSLYFGGGTPTYLTTKQLENLITYLKNNVEIIPNSEITIEAAPETITKEKLEALYELGINRLSFGVQSFSDDILKLCGRRHNAMQAINAFELAKNCGFNNINLDLISGLPNQTPDRWEYDLSIIEQLEPASLTVYPLYLQGNSIMRKMKNLKFPDKKENLLLNIMVTEKMKSLGYQQFPVHFFVKTSENVLKQWNDKWQKMKEVVGLGVSCYGYFNSMQYHNHLDLEKYREAVKDGKLSVWKGIKLNKEEQMARFIVFGFKTGFVNKEAFEQKFNASIEKIYKDKLEKLEQLGLIESVGKLIRLTYTGTLYSEEVCIQFFTEETKNKIKKVSNGYTGYSTDLQNYY